MFLPSLGIGSRPLGNGGQHPGPCIPGPGSRAETQGGLGTSLTREDCTATETLSHSPLGRGQSHQDGLSWLENNFQMKNSREFYSTVQKKFGSMPFNLRSFDSETKAKMGVVECVTHKLVEPFQVLHEKDSK